MPWYFWHGLRDTSSFVMRMAGLEKRHLIIMKLLTCAKHFICLIFAQGLCCNCQSLVIFCRIGGSEWLSNLFKFFKLNSLRVKFGLVDYKFVI